MAKAKNDLVIVESPAKARTIEKYLGPGYQVTASMTEESTFEREMAPLRAIQDNYPKYVITLDRYTLGNYEGIQVIHAVDWLLGS